MLLGPGILHIFGLNSPTLNEIKSSLVHVACILTNSLLLKFTCLLPDLARLSALTKPKVRLTEPIPMERRDVTSATCSVLNACPRLLSFAQPCTMTAEVWASLPHSVTLCCMGGICPLMWSSHSSPSPIWPQKLNVRKMLINAPSVSLRGLSTLLAAAPSLAFILAGQGTLSVSAEWTPYDIPEHLWAELNVVNDRLRAGLLIYVPDESRKFVPVSSKLCFVFHVRETTAVPPIFSATTMPLLALTHIVFNCNNTRTDILQLTRVFPRLIELKLADTILNESDLHTLSLCTSLTDLVLEACCGVTCALAAALCASSTSLLRLSCDKCKDMSAASGHWRGRGEWGGNVQVTVTKGGQDGSWCN